MIKWLAVGVLIAALVLFIQLADMHRKRHPKPAPAKLRAYLAGPMTGYSDYNALGFTAAAIWAVQQGWAPVSPHDTDPSHDGPCPEGERHKGHPNACWYAAGCRTVLECDLVVLLPGWRTSVGARLEEQTARGADMPIEIAPDPNTYTPRHHEGAVQRVAAGHTPLGARVRQGLAPTAYELKALPAGPGEHTARLAPPRPKHPMGGTR